MKYDGTAYAPLPAGGESGHGTTLLICGESGEHACIQPTYRVHSAVTGV